MQLRGQGSKILEPLDLEIEKTCKHIRREQKTTKMLPTLNERKRPVVAATPSCITLSEEARDYELRQSYFNAMPQFHGLLGENPLNFITEFYEFIQGIPRNGLAEDQLKLKCFPYTLKGAARGWFLEQAPASYTTWEGIYNAFMSKYYTPTMTQELRQRIFNFKQQNGELFQDAWRRFKSLLRECPHHRIPLDLQIDTFYNGLNAPCQAIVDNRAEGYIGNKNETEALRIIESIASNPQLQGGDYKVVGMNEISITTEINKRLEQMESKIEQKFQTALQAVLGGVKQIANVESIQSPEGNLSQHLEEVNFMNSYGNRGNNNPSNQQRWNQGSNWKPQPQSGAPNFGPCKETTMEDMMQFISKSMESMKAQNEENHSRVEASIGNLHSQFNKLDLRFEDQNIKLNQRIDTIEQYAKASIRNLEVQLGQLAQKVSSREQGKLPTTTEVNPRESVMAITTRSGRQTEDPKMPERRKTPEEQEEVSHTPLPPIMPQYVPPIPYPQKLKKKGDEKKHKKILDIFKKLSINIPFAEAIAEIPSYAKFLKGIISNKKKLEEFATVALTEECSAIIQNKLPPKLKDPGNFTIPCSIGKIGEVRSLCDLGASINLMPYSLFKKLSVGELQPTTVALQLADRTIRYPIGIMEDVLVKVGKFYFPVDFLVLDMEEMEVPVILGRSFLATSAAVIDVQAGTVRLRVGEDDETFHVWKTQSILTQNLEVNTNPFTPPKPINIMDIKKAQIFGPEDPPTHPESKKNRPPTPWPPHDLKKVTLVKRLREHNHT
ncbi:unnamed protein product [Cuscuta epithymum]|uniref:Retrotransposon gag domain-containing protein n=1 Tax=Cuscuta epithymum TaxID=186058 RepID=A0AAV0DKA7_9ASTE|nr:unnamed protein product [Cuscuta epithymum]